MSAPISNAQFALLNKQVASEAIHTSPEESSAKRCHPGTRSEILKDLKEWAAADTYPSPTKWISGSSGTGKSTILRTIADTLSLDKSLIASFFFSSTDDRRNTTQYFFPTIAYQLCEAMPIVQPHLLDVIAKDPLIFSRSLEVQARCLIVEPLVRIHADGQIPLSHPRILLVDGLEECYSSEEQSDLLHSLTLVVQQVPFPLALLISGPSHHPQPAASSFGPRAESISYLSLDDHPHSYGDVEKYLIDRFQEIVESHPLRETLASTESDQWPGPKIIDLLARKASGQFLFASLMFRSVDSPWGSPGPALKGILRFLDSENVQSLQPLDILYTVSFSIVDPQTLPPVFRVLGILLIHRSPSRCLGFLQWFLGLSDIRALLFPFSSLLFIGFDDAPIKIFHSSLREFLLDRSRSMGFHIDVGMVYEEVARMSLNHLVERSFYFTSLLKYLIPNMSFLFENATDTTDFHDAIQRLDILRLTTIRSINISPRDGTFLFCPMFLLAIKTTVFPQEFHTQKMVAYESHLRGAVQKYIENIQLTCLLFLSRVGRRNLPSCGGERTLVQAVFRDVQYIDRSLNGLGLTDYLDDEDPGTHASLWPLNSKGRQVDPILDRLQQQPLQYLQRLVEDTKGVGGLYANAATYLLKFIDQDLEPTVHITFTGWIAHLLSKADPEADLALQLVKMTLSPEFQNSPQLGAAIQVYLSKHKETSGKENDRALVGASELPRPLSPAGDFYAPVPPTIASDRKLSSSLDDSQIKPHEPNFQPATQITPASIPSPATYSQETRGAHLSSRMTTAQTISNPSSTHLASRSRPIRHDKVAPLSRAGTPRSTTGAVGATKSENLSSPASSTSRGGLIPARTSSTDPRSVLPSGKSTNPKTSSHNPQLIVRETRPSGASPSRTIKSPILKPAASKTLPARGVHRPGPQIGIQDTKGAPATVLPMDPAARRPKRPATEGNPGHGEETADAPTIPLDIPDLDPSASPSPDFVPSGEKSRTMDTMAMSPEASESARMVTPTVTSPVGLSTTTTKAPATTTSRPGTAPSNTRSRPSAPAIPTTARSANSSKTAFTNKVKEKSTHEHASPRWR